MHVQEPISHKIAVKIMDGYQISVFKGSHDAFDLIVIDPHAACLDGAALAFFQSDCGMIHKYTSFSAVFVSSVSAFLQDVKKRTGILPWVF